jgi:imidazolonepropionase-like amidohydrolase
MLASWLLLPFLLSAPNDGDGPARADNEMLPTLWIHGERIIVRPGVELEDVAILVEKGVIVSIGPDVQAPAGAVKIEGKVICAGFIDPWSSLGLDARSVSDVRTTASTLTVDSLDPFTLPHLRKEALAAGVTSLRLQAGLRAPLGGIGAVVRTNTGNNSEVLLKDACFSATLSSPLGGRSADIFSRAGELVRLVGQLRDGEKYRLDEVEYRHSMEEWQKEIDAQTKKLDEGFKKVKKKRDKDKKSAESKGKEFKDKKYKEDKQPKMPRQDPNRAVMARVAEGELPLVVEARDITAIRNLLKQTTELKRLRMVISGANGAGTFGEQLAERKIPVLLWPSADAGGLHGRADKDLALAGELSRAGVEVLLGSGGGNKSRDLRLLAAMAMSHGLSADDALNAITYGPAKAFDVSDRVGSLKRGMDADILVFDGEPLDTTSKLKFVISRGRVVTK